jgi:hypothetical protein
MLTLFYRRFGGKDGHLHGEADIFAVFNCVSLLPGEAVLGGRCIADAQVFAAIVVELLEHLSILDLDLRSVFHLILLGEDNLAGHLVLNKLRKVHICVAVRPRDLDCLVEVKGVVKAYLALLACDLQR